ncbi:MAG TPA: LysM domain-containing protein, partial [Beijerinckiaceae bacterium]|nr:LysM domain-containing protein [Beijerinckiaceae bacterium]
MPNEIVVGSNRASLYDIAEKYHVSMSDLYALNPQFQRGTTDGKFNAALEKQKIASGAGKRDGDYIEQGELIKLPDAAPSGPFYFYKSEASTYQREAVLKAVDKVRKATPDGQGALTEEQFVAIATRVKGVSEKEARDLFNELAQETISVADGPATISAREVIDARASAVRTADNERAKEARAEEQRRQAAASRVSPASEPG